MLNGVDPVIIFQLYKLVPPATTSVAGFPIHSDIKNRQTISVVPIYLSEVLTGLFIESETKNIDIDTTINSLSNGDPAQVNQKALGAVVTVNLIAESGSIGLTLLLATVDLLLDKVTSQEYEMTYVHGATTIFGGLIHSFSVEQGGNDDKYRIKLEISKGRPKTTSDLVERDPNAVRIGTTGTLPPATPPVPAGVTPSSGQSVIVPRT